MVRPGSRMRRRTLRGDPLRGWRQACQRLHDPFKLNRAAPRRQPHTQASQEARDAGAFIAQVSSCDSDRVGPIVYGLPSEKLMEEASHERYYSVDARYLTVALPSPAWIAVVNGVSPSVRVALHRK